MVAQKRYLRFMGLAAIGGPLVVAGIAWAGPAGADSGSYLTHLHAVGIQDVGGDPALLQTGQKLCTQVGYGATSQQLVNLAVQRSDAREGAHGLTPEQATELVDYAIADLCPNY
jgi:hypothetical protein